MDLPKNIDQGNFAEGVEPSRMLDFRNPKQSGDNRKRLIETYNRLVDDLAQFFRRFCVVSSALKANTNARQGRS